MFPYLIPLVSNARVSFVLQEYVPEKPMGVAVHHHLAWRYVFYHVGFRDLGLVIGRFGRRCAFYPLGAVMGKVHFICVPE
jgi:hypothetical protein